MTTQNETAGIGGNSPDSPISMESIKENLDNDLTCSARDEHGDECNAEQDPENGIVVGYPPESEEPQCNICLETWLKENTSLATRESQVVALKLLGYSHSKIAILFDARFDEESPGVRTIGTHSRRAGRKFDEALSTALTIGPLYDDETGQNAAEQRSEA